ncbi:MAG: hypothetical protein ACLR5K_12055 [Acutalibacteraceae bacterium]
MGTLFIESLVISAGLGFIPATIAKNKGYNFGVWWLYGWMLFIVAIIHVNLIPDKTALHFPSNVQTYIPSNADWSTADELKKIQRIKRPGCHHRRRVPNKKKTNL